MPVGTIIDFYLLIFLSICFVIIGILFILYSKNKKFLYVSIIFLILLGILEYPHLFFIDFYYILDILIHIIAGVVLFLFFFLLFSISRYIGLRQKSYILSLLSVIFLILFIELFLSILDILTIFINPISWNILLDIFTTTIGGIFGYFMVHLINKKKIKISF